MADAETTNNTTSDDMEDQDISKEHPTTAATQDPGEASNKLETSEGCPDKLETSDESSDKPETSEESSDKPETSGKSADKLEISEESSDKPETSEESSDKPETSGKSSDKLEISEESSDKPETSGKSSDKLEISEESSDKPETSGEPYDKPESSEESSDKPETSGESSDKPETSEESSDKPKIPEESSDKPETSEESSDKPKTLGNISMSAADPAAQDPTAPDQHAADEAAADVIEDKLKIDKPQSVEINDSNEENTAETEKDTGDPTCISEQSQDGVESETVKISGDERTEGDVKDAPVDAESVIEQEPGPHQIEADTSLIHPVKDENETVRETKDVATDETVNVKQDGVIENNVPNISDENDASEKPGDGEESRTAELTKGATQDCIEKSEHTAQESAEGNVQDSDHPLEGNAQESVSQGNAQDPVEQPAEGNAQDLVQLSQGTTQDSVEEQPTETVDVETEADKISEDLTAKSDISEQAASVTKGSDKVVTFGDNVKSDSGDVYTNYDASLPKSPTSTIRDLAASRQSERTSEYVYDDSSDFPTPDFYDKSSQRSATPSAVESGKVSRQDSGSRRNLLSRGESNKSVTFADEIKKDDEVEGDVQEDGGEKDDTKLEAIEGDKAQPSAEEEPESVFATAVSEEKIEEATARAKKSISNTQSVAVDLWGQASYEIQSMGNVINKKATEHFEKGCKLSDQGDHCQAILAFDKAINLCPKMVTYYLARGESYLQICDFQSAILNLKRACVLDPNNNKYYGKLAFVYYFYGQTLFDQNLFAEALEAFSRASEMRPEVVGYHTRSVACLAALQRHGECLALVNKRLEMEHDNPDLYIMRARLHELFRNTSLCYYDLRDALALNPDQEEAQMLMKRLEERAQESRDNSVSLQLQGRLKEALNKITTAIETNPSVAEYHLLRGALHRRLQDYNAAIDDYLLALDKTEHNEQDHIYTESQRQLLLTYNDFAVECFLGKHYEEAIILLNKALKGEKREKGLYINRGDCFFRLNELHFALADYHQALEIDQSDWMIRSRIASIHSEFGLLDYEEHSYQEAEARFTVAIQHNPRMGSYYIYRAKVRFMLENQTDARQDLLMALHLDPSNDDILSLMPRLFPGKSVGDLMRSKAARTAKIAVDNAVVTASPIKLPEIHRDGGSKVTDGQQDDKVNGASKHVAFATNGVVPHREPSMPDIRECMSETQFNKVLTKNKKKISDHVKTLLHDRKTLSNGVPIALAPQPPARPYTIKGGGWKKGDDDRPQGWRTFSLGMGVMNK